MEMSATLKQIDSLKKEAEKLQPVKPELEKVFWDKFRLEFNYNSNHMEGNTLTYGHTQILLKSGDVVGKYNIRELQEMKAHDLALKIIRDSADDPEFSFTQKFIREINQTILVEPFYNDAITQDGKPTQKLITPGEYKKTPNSVRLPNGEMFNYASPEETPALMGDLMDWYEKETKANELHPVQIAALFHYKIVRIHPFDDSNGRTARLLMNYILLKNDYSPLVINSADKKNYLIALNETDAGDIEAFVKYITSLQLHWQGLLLKALKGEKIEEDTDLDKEIQLLKKDNKSAKDKIEITFNKVILKELFSISILPLINRIAIELSKLDELFLKRSTLFKAIGQGACLSIDGLPVFLGQILENYISAPFYFEYYNIHSQFRKESEVNFDFTTLIAFEFSEYSYSVRYSGVDNLTIKKYYHQQLSNDEINDFGKEVLRLELKAIRHL